MLFIKIIFKNHFTTDWPKYLKIPVEGKTTIYMIVIVVVCLFIFIFYFALLFVCFCLFVFFCFICYGIDAEINARCACNKA